MNVYKKKTRLARTMALLAAVATALGACGGTSTDEPTASATQESSVAEVATTQEPEATEAATEDSCEKSYEDWQQPTWEKGCSYAYAVAIMSLLNYAANEGDALVAFVDDEGNVEELFTLIGLPDSDVADLMKPLAGTEMNNCGHTAADGYYTRWCSADGTVSVFYENIEAAMSADETAEIDVVADLLADAANIVIEASWPETESAADLGCVAGTMMGALVERVVWMEEWEAIRDVHFSETTTTAAFDEGFLNLCVV